MIRHLVIGLLSLVCVVALSLDSEAFARRCCKPARGCCAKKSCCSTGCATNACAAGACAATTTPAPAVAGAPTQAPAADKASDGAATESTTVATRTRRFGNGTLRAAASNLMVRR